MAQLVVPNSVLVRLIWAQSGTPFAIQVLGGRKVGASTVDQALANTLGAAVKTSFTTHLASRVVVAVSLSKVAIRDISVANRPEFQDAGAAVAGTGPDAAMLPPQIAMCATLRTASAGKNFRGRSYFPGFGVNSLAADGKAGAAVGTSIVAFLTALQTNFTASGFNLAVVSRKLSQVTDVSLIQVRDTTWDTIRGRAVAGV
jgi:hypothetical protein